MYLYIERKQSRFPRAIISLLMAVTFVASMITPYGYAQPSPSAGLLNLPNPGTMIPVSPVYQPTVMAGLKLNPENPLRFQFILDKGDSELTGLALREESEKLIRYFLAAMTVPEEDLWVNLSPYEDDRIIPEQFGYTEMGKDLLAQDYLLKQITASLLYPEEELGKSFWDKVYAKAQAIYGTTSVPVNTFNKVWILPETARIYAEGDTAMIVETHLKVMLEEDYIALLENLENEGLGTNRLKNADVEQLSDVSAQVVREVIIPEIEREVNNGKNFAPLRQIYNSMILATWYKENLKESILSKVYAGQNKISGVDLDDKTLKDQIYQQYLAAFEEGVFNYIREDYDPYKKERLPRKYFSGGFVGQVMTATVEQDATLPEVRGIYQGKLDITPGGALSVENSELLIVDAGLDAIQNFSRQVEQVRQREEAGTITVQDVETLRTFAESNSAFRQTHGTYYAGVLNRQQNSSNPQIAQLATRYYQEESARTAGIVAMGFFDRFTRSGRERIRSEQQQQRLEAEWEAANTRIENESEAVFDLVLRGRFNEAEQKMVEAAARMGDDYTYFRFLGQMAKDYGELGVDNKAVRTIKMMEQVYNRNRQWEGNTAVRDIFGSIYNHKAPMAWVHAAASVKKVGRRSTPVTGPVTLEKLSALADRDAHTAFARAAELSPADEVRFLVFSNVMEGLNGRKFTEVGEFGRAIAVLRRLAQLIDQNPQLFTGEVKVQLQEYAQQSRQGDSRGGRIASDISKFIEVMESLRPDSRQALGINSSDTVIAAQRAFVTRWNEVERLTRVQGRIEEWIDFDRAERAWRELSNQEVSPIPTLPVPATGGELSSEPVPLTRGESIDVRLIGPLKVSLPNDIQLSVSIAPDNLNQITIRDDKDAEVRLGPGTENGGVYRIGRNHQNPFGIASGTTREISGDHLQIFWDPLERRVELVDSSSNGTTVDVPVIVQDSEEIQANNRTAIAAYVTRDVTLGTAGSRQELMHIRYLEEDGTILSISEQAPKRGEIGRNVVAVPLAGLSEVQPLTADQRSSVPENLRTVLDDLSGRAGSAEGALSAESDFIKLPVEQKIMAQKIINVGSERWSKVRPDGPSGEMDQDEFTRLLHFYAIVDTASRNDPGYFDASLDNLMNVVNYRAEVELRSGTFSIDLARSVLSDRFGPQGSSPDTDLFSYVSERLNQIETHKVFDATLLRREELEIPFTRNRLQLANELLLDISEDSADPNVLIVAELNGSNPVRIGPGTETGNVLRIGRRHANPWGISEDSTPRISGNHVQITWDPQSRRIHFHDVSSNGTYVYSEPNPDPAFIDSNNQIALDRLITDSLHGQTMFLSIFPLSGLIFGTTEFPGMHERGDEVVGVRIDNDGIINVPSNQRDSLEPNVARAIESFNARRRQDGGALSAEGRWDFMDDDGSIYGEAVDEYTRDVVMGLDQEDKSDQIRSFRIERPSGEEFGQNFVRDLRDNSLWMHMQNDSKDGSNFFEWNFHIAQDENGDIYFDQMMVEPTRSTGFVGESEFRGWPISINQRRIDEIKRDALNSIAPFKDRVIEVLNDANFEPEFFLTAWYDDAGRPRAYDMISKKAAEGMLKDNSMGSLNIRRLGVYSLPTQLTAPSTTGALSAESDFVRQQLDQAKAREVVSILLTENNPFGFGYTSNLLLAVSTGDADLLDRAPSTVNMDDPVVRGAVGSAARQFDAARAQEMVSTKYSEGDQARERYLGLIRLIERTRVQETVTLDQGERARFFPERGTRISLPNDAVLSFDQIVVQEQLVISLVDAQENVMVLGSLSNAAPWSHTIGTQAGNRFGFSPQTTPDMAEQQFTVEFNGITVSLINHSANPTRLLLPLEDDASSLRESNALFLGEVLSDAVHENTLGDEIYVRTLTTNGLIVGLTLNQTPGYIRLGVNGDNTLNVDPGEHPMLVASVRRFNELLTSELSSEVNALEVRRQFDRYARLLYGGQVPFTESEEDIPQLRQNLSQNYPDVRFSVAFDMGYNQFRQAVLDQQAELGRSLRAMEIQELAREFVPTLPERSPSSPAFGRFGPAASELSAELTQKGIEWRDQLVAEMDQVGAAVNTFAEADQVKTILTAALEPMVGVKAADQELPDLLDYALIGDALRGEWRRRGLEAQYGNLNQYLGLLMTEFTMNTDDFNRLKERVDVLIASGSDTVAREVQLDDTRMALWAQGVALATHIRNFGPHAEMVKDAQDQNRLEFSDTEYLVQVVRQLIPVLIESKNAPSLNAPVKASPGYADTPLQFKGRDLTQRDLMLWGLVVMLDPMLHNYLSYGLFDNAKISDARAYVQETYGTASNMIDRIMTSMLTDLKYTDANGNLQEIDSTEVDTLLTEAFELFLNDDGSTLRSPFKAFVNANSIGEVLTDVQSLRFSDSPIVDQVFTFALNERALQQIYPAGIEARFVPLALAKTPTGEPSYGLFLNQKWSARFPGLAQAIQDGVENTKQFRKFYRQRLTARHPSEKGGALSAETTRLDPFGAIDATRAIDERQRENVGGIDINPALMNLEVEGGGIQFDIPFNPQIFDGMPVDGFAPVIFQITPIQSLPQIIGSADESSPSGPLAKAIRK